MEDRFNLEEKAPELFALAEKADSVITKHGLAGRQARVALCLDISGSMEFEYKLYSSGKVQKLVEEALALAVLFDDNGAVDVFLFGQKAHNLGEVTPDNFKGFIDRTINWGDGQGQYRLEGRTNYGKALREVRKHYWGGDADRNTPVTGDDEPVFLIFATDGAASDKSDAVRQIKNASFENMFIQFVAIGADYVPGTMVTKTKKEGGFLGFGAKNVEVEVEMACPSQFQFLNDLDDNVPGRFVDNAGFFSVKSPADMDPEYLFDLMMTEFPQWLGYSEVKAMWK